MAVLFSAESYAPVEPEERSADYQAAECCRGAWYPDALPPTGGSRHPFKGNIRHSVDDDRQKDNNDENHPRRCSRQPSSDYDPCGGF